jgi:hypothetical protein
LKNGSHKVIPNASLQHLFPLHFQVFTLKNKWSKYETQNLIYHFSVSKQNSYIHGVTLQIAIMCAPVEACTLVAAAAVYKQGVATLSLFESKTSPA